MTMTRTEILPATLPPLYARGHQLDPQYTGLLRDSADLAGDFDALRNRMEEDGYIYLPGYLDRDQAIGARREMVNRLADQGILAGGVDPMEGVVAEGQSISFDPKLAIGNKPLLKLLYSGRMMAFYEQFLGGAVRHFDYTWVRAVTHGLCAQPHCDIVYMGRGTHRLYTSWTPLTDIPFEQGGLMVLENSHRHKKLREQIEHVDVDTYCLNRTGLASLDRGTRGQGGGFNAPPPKLRNSLGGRWLTREYRMGDLMIFNMFLVHGSTDNRTNRIRLSSDSRYQLASEPADERWIGEHPIAHGPAGKRGQIC
jgi:hypothetical protein